MEDIRTLLRPNPIIAACRQEQIADAVDSRASMVLLMNATLTWLIKPQFQQMRERKPILIHVDLVKGLTTDREAVLFLRDFVRPWGIVSTKSATVRAAQREGVPAIQRVFLIDSTSLRLSIDSIRENQAAAVEVMPGIAPDAIAQVRAAIDLPVISGGLIRQPNQVAAAIAAGATAVSTSAPELWAIEPT